MMENEMLEIYKYITNLQKEIGNDVEIKLSVRDGGLIIHAYYYNEDFNVQLTLSPDEIECIGLHPTAIFADRFKYEFDWHLRAIKQL